MLAKSAPEQKGGSASSVAVNFGSAVAVHFGMVRSRQEFEMRDPSGLLRSFPMVTCGKHFAHELLIAVA